jgi:hypothetical protein
MSRLLEKIDRLIKLFGNLNRPRAFAALDAAYSSVRAQTGLAAEEVTHFLGFVELVLGQHARNIPMRISGARQAAKPKDVRLSFITDEDKATYEAALHDTMDFLARNFLDHLEKYAPHKYRIAALRAFAKRYDEERRIRAGTVSVDSIPERVARENPHTVFEAELVAPSNPGESQAADDIPDEQPDRGIFHDWYFANLSRRELAQLHGMSAGDIEQTILRVGCIFEQGRRYRLIRWLLDLKEDGDVLWLWSKELTAEQIAQKVGLSAWVVYKRLGALRKRLDRLRQMGAPGRAFLEWLFYGREPKPELAEAVHAIFERFGEELGLSEAEFVKDSLCPRQKPLIL